MKYLLISLFTLTLFAQDGNLSKEEHYLGENLLLRLESSKRAEQLLSIQISNVRTEQKGYEKQLNDLINDLCNKRSIKVEVCEIDFINNKIQEKKKESK